MRTGISLVLVASFVMGAAFLNGCSKPAQEKSAQKQEKAGDEDHSGHDHPSEGPHHGQLIELGREEYHAELVHDDEKHLITVYLLDAQAKQAVPIEQSELVINLTAQGKPHQYKLAAAPLEGEASGQSSRFQASDEALAEALDSEGAKGRFNLTINGRPYVGNIEHHDHDDHEHQK